MTFLIKKNLFLFFFIIFLISSVYSTNIEVKITEDSVQTKLLSGSYSIIADGTIELYNPSNISKIYDFILPLSLDSLIGISKVKIDSSSDKFSFNYNKIGGHIIKPNEKVRVGYHIFGLVKNDLYSILNVDNISVLDYYTDDFEFSSNTIISLEKIAREGNLYDVNRSLNTTVAPNINTSRLIVTSVQNPTDFNFFAREIKLYKTKTSDPFFKSGDLIQTYYNVTVNPFSYEELNFFDFFSGDYDVYWVNSYVLINSSIDSTLWKSVTEQKKPSSGGSGGVFGYNFSTPNILDSIVLKKSADKSFLQGEDEVKVIVKIANINNFPIYNLTLFDEIPSNYEIKEISYTNKLLEGRVLEFNIDKLDKFESTTITYTLINKDELKGITYLKPAELIHGNDSIFSEGVLLIHDLLPDKKVFIQKEINYIDNDFARITIRVQNLGSTLLRDLLVSDVIDDNAIIKEISQILENNERGLWRIKELKPGEEWKVSYIIERNANLDTIPNIFGLDRTQVYGTLISAEEVITIFQEQPRTFEKVGMGLAVGLLIFYLLF